MDPLGSRTRGQMTITQIISGGQTGEDRAGLDVALAHHFPRSGWYSKGRKAEDGIESKAPFEGTVMAAIQVHECLRDKIVALEKGASF